MEKEIQRDINELVGSHSLRVVGERLGLNQMTLNNWLRDGMSSDIYNLISAAILEINIEESGGQGGEYLQGE